VRWLVDPIRKVSCLLPWWFTKYLIATPLVVPYFMYAKLIRALFANPRFGFLPLHAYSVWISQAGLSPSSAMFAFDQLVTPQTAYIRRSTVDDWLHHHPDVDPAAPT
jgi:hypothetical protein